MDQYIHQYTPTSQDSNNHLDYHMSHILKVSLNMFYMVIDMQYIDFDIHNNIMDWQDMMEYMMININMNLGSMMYIQMKQKYINNNQMYMEDMRLIIGMLLVDRLNNMLIVIVYNYLYMLYIYMASYSHMYHMASYIYDILYQSPRMANYMLNYIYSHSHLNNTVIHMMYILLYH